MIQFYLLISSRAWLTPLSSEWRRSVACRRFALLEGLHQARAGVLPDRPLGRLVVERARGVPTNQQEDGEPAAPAAHRRRDAYTRRGPRQGQGLRTREGFIPHDRGPRARSDRDREQPHDRNRLL